MFVLDSDTYSHMHYQHPKVLTNIQDAVSQQRVIGITVVTKIELLRGRMDALLKADSHEGFLDAQKKLLATEEGISKLRMILLDEAALHIFDQLMKVRGLKKIGRADLLIASVARAKNATLVTRNQRHFKLVPQLKLANWVD